METPNLDYIKELSGGDIAFEESILNVLKKEFPIEHTTFLKNFKKENFKEAANNVNKIKPKNTTSAPQPIIIQIRKQKVKNAKMNFTIFPFAFFARTNNTKLAVENI